ncbi:hypothetical protein C8R44DRAFT_992535 [Mycena epipterygia]|nr:hypothetical protein C8R44DRAFT_992535 [Mycena epipterygia]
MHRRFRMPSPKRASASSSHPAAPPLLPEYPDTDANVTHHGVQVAPIPTVARLARPLQVALHPPAPLRRFLLARVQFRVDILFGRRSVGRFLGLSKFSGKESREREAERDPPLSRGASGAAQSASPCEYTDADNSFINPPGSPPSAYCGTAHLRRRSERHFSANTPPSSSSNRTHGVGNDMLQLARTSRGPWFFPARRSNLKFCPDSRSDLAGKNQGPTSSRLCADGPLAARLSGSFAHLAGGARATCVLLKSEASSSTSTSRKGDSTATTRKNGSGGSGSAKTSPLDTAVRYLGGHEGWTRDAEWGCMLRTGQSFLFSVWGELRTSPVPTALARRARRPRTAIVIPQRPGRAFRCVYTALRLRARPRVCGFVARLVGVMHAENDKYYDGEPEKDGDNRSESLSPREQY